MIPPPEIRELTIKDYVDIVLRRIWIVAVIVVVIPSLVAFRDFSAVKIYRTSAKLLFKESMPQVTGQEDIIYKGGIPSREDQISLLSSRILAERVVKKLNLAANKQFIGVKDLERNVLNMVNVSQQRESRIVSINVTGRDPLIITKIANAWAEEFIRTDIDQRAVTAKHGIQWLQEQMGSTLSKLEEAEKKLNDFLQQNRIVTMPEVGGQKQGTVEALRSQQNKLEKEAIEAYQKYGEKHPKIANLEAELAAVKQKLKEEQDTIFALQNKNLEYKILDRDVDTYKVIYNDFVKRIKELEISKEMVTSNVQFIDDAQIPWAPISPQPAKDISRALIGSLLLAVALCYFLEYADSTLKTSEDVEFYTKMPFLGYIPSARKEIRKGENRDLVSFIKPYSQTSEAFRNLRVSIIFSFPEDKPLHSIMITSSIAKEGKSFVATNLAISFAQTKEDTLLIDADMRRGRLSQVFEQKNKNGLSSLLAGVCTLEQAVVSTSTPNLYVIYAGPSTPNPAELLSSQKLVNILDTAKTKFKRIIIDAPPALGVSDTIMLGDKCDGVIYVIKTGATPLKLITEVRKILGKKVKVIGAVLNNVSVDAEHYYSYYRYYHYTPKKI
ncbi:MAG: polysaccharide biosynthesis tyrosine autokinase [Candidatus Omnitrophica bacterium]|nr:polysaccharide biosynthesis tyrosine autokinase [Candidatus Omnitrophota bacterium]